MRTAPDCLDVMVRVPPLTRETDGYQACNSNYCLGEFPVASALNEG